MSRIGIITNPYSKLNKRNSSRLGQIRDIIDDKADLFITKSLGELKSVVAHMAEKNITIIGISGGDGTISRCLTEIIGAFPPDNLPRIVVLKGGTMNLIAAELGLSGSDLPRLKKLIKNLFRIDKFPVRTLNSIKVGERYGFLYGDGSAVTILNEFYLHKSGIGRAIWLFLRLIFSFLINGKFIKKLVFADTIETSIPQFPKFTTLANFAGSISKLPLGFPLLPLVKRYPDLIQYTFITSPREKLLWYLPAIMLQHKEGNSLGKYSWCGTELQLLRNESFEYTLDGEVFTNAKGIPLAITKGPKIDFILI